MINKKTVLILGAGASSSYGFPLGRGLRDLACAFPIDGIAGTCINKIGYSFEELELFINTLRHSGYTSVDWFLEERKEFISIGKAVIAACLIPFELPGKLFPPHAPTEHWYELLVNIMTSHMDRFTDNALSIVTFNYDRSFEFYFLKVLETRLNSQEKAIQLLNSIEIVHVHGSLGELAPYKAHGRTYDGQLSTDGIQLAAENILVVGEANDDSAQFEKARALLSEAEKIVFLGFGFHSESVSRLGVFNDYWNSEKCEQVRVFATTRGIPPHIWENIKVNVLNGSVSNQPRSSASVFKYLNEVVQLN